MGALHHGERANYRGKIVNRFLGVDFPVRTPVMHVPDQLRHQVLLGFLVVAAHRMMGSAALMMALPIVNS